MPSRTMREMRPYLDQWKTLGVWPAIHAPMASFAVAHMRAESILDLGCSYGLLGARISHDAGGIPCIGIDADQKVIDAAVAAGVEVTFRCLKVSEATLPDLQAIIAEHQPKALIARRVLPELWGENLPGGGLFAAMLAECGVKEILLEGRVASERATNPLRSIHDEVALLSEQYREVVRSKALSYLVLR